MAFSSQRKRLQTCVDSLLRLAMALDCKKLFSPVESGARSLTLQFGVVVEGGEVGEGGGGVPAGKVVSFPAIIWAVTEKACLIA